MISTKNCYFGVMIYHLVQGFLVANPKLTKDQNGPINQSMSLIKVYEYGPNDID